MVKGHKARRLRSEETSAAADTTGRVVPLPGCALKSGQQLMEIASVSENPVCGDPLSCMRMGLSESFERSADFPEAVEV